MRSLIIGIIAFLIIALVIRGFFGVDSLDNAVVSGIVSGMAVALLMTIGIAVGWAVAVTVRRNRKPK